MSEHSEGRPVQGRSDTARSVDAGAVPAALRLIASVVAPTTVLTALLFYYGRLHAQALTRQLRVQFTVFDFSFQDYLVRSADGLFVPLVAAALFAAGCFWASRLIEDRLSPSARRTALKMLAPSAGLVGAGLLATAISAGLNSRVFASIPELGGLCLSLGVLLVTAGTVSARAVSAEQPAEESEHTIASEATRRRAGQASSGPVAVGQWTVVFVLASIGLFWAVNNYALRVGQARGEEIELRLPTEADVVLYSDKNLNLQVPGVRSTACSQLADPNGYRFRYEGLKLVLQSGGQYLFLPAGWNQLEGVSLVLPRSSGLRLEFSPPGRGARPPC